MMMTRPVKYDARLVVLCPADLPRAIKAESAQDAAAIVSSVLAAVAAGEITPTDAAEVGKLIDSYVKALRRSAEKSYAVAGGSQAIRDPGFAPFPTITEDRMKRMTDDELTHAILGART